MEYFVALKENGEEQLPKYLYGKIANILSERKLQNV